MSDPMYRTPAGTQSETTGERMACGVCGGALGRRDAIVQGADPDAPPFAEFSRSVRKCRTCSVAALLRQGY